uniref:Uncharacterized protein n=1 Tax=Glossina brevipalpis TaxID=37001 RepID=A0A1A9W0C6_9MUSC
MDCHKTKQGRKNELTTKGKNRNFDKRFICAGMFVGEPPDFSIRVLDSTRENLCGAFLWVRARRLFNSVSQRLLYARPQIKYVRMHVCVFLLTVYFSTFITSVTFDKYIRTRADYMYLLEV